MLKNVIDFSFDDGKISNFLLIIEQIISYRDYEGNAVAISFMNEKDWRALKSFFKFQKYDRFFSSE
jgi:hypothetical protein